MSRENVELVLRATTAYNDRDVARMLDDWSPDAVLDWSRSEGPDAGVYRGREVIAAFIQRFLDAWETIRIDLVDEPMEIEPGLLLAENVTYLRGRDGIEVQARSTWVITIRDGVQTSLTLYRTRREALEAAGSRSDA